MTILIINIIKYIITISYSLNFVEPADTLVKQPETCYSSKSAYQKLHYELFHHLPFYFICYYSILFTIVGVLQRILPNVCQNTYKQHNNLFISILHIYYLHFRINHPTITKGQPYQNEKPCRLKRVILRHLQNNIYFCRRT